MTNNRETKVRNSRQNFKTPTLHTASAPALRASVKTWLSCRNDTIKVIFYTVNTNKDNSNGALSSSNSSLEHSGFNLIKNYIFFTYYPTWRYSTLTRRITSELPDVGAKLETCRPKMFHNFHFLQSDMAFGIINSFP